MSLGLPEIEGITEEQIRQEDFGLIAEVDELPDKPNLNSGGVLRGMVELTAKAKYKVYEFFAKTVLPQAYWRTGSGAWLDLKAREMTLERLGAVRAQHQVTLSRTDATGNLIVPAGGIVGTQPDASGKRYRFEVGDEVVCPDGQAEISVTVTALEAGADHNVAADTITEFVTPFPGWDSVTNPEGSLVREGADEEEDGPPLEAGQTWQDAQGLRRRIALQWAAGNRCNWAAYEEAALSVQGVKSVHLVKVGGGVVHVYITGQSGLPSQDLIDQVQTALTDKETGMPATDAPVVFAPSAVSIDWDVSITALPGYSAELSDIETQAETALNALHTPGSSLAAVTPLGVGQDVVLSQVAAMLMANDARIKDVAFTSPAANVEISEVQLAVIGADPVVTVTEASEE